MANSNHPLYKEGYKRGRARAQREARRLTAAERWNEVYLGLLPIALQVGNDWTDEYGRRFTTAEDKASLAARWTDAAMKYIK